MGQVAWIVLDSHAPVDYTGFWIFPECLSELCRVQVLPRGACYWINVFYFFLLDTHESRVYFGILYIHRV